FHRRAEAWIADWAGLPSLLLGCDLLGETGVAQTLDDRLVVQELKLRVAVPNIVSYSRHRVHVRLQPDHFDEFRSRLVDLALKAKGAGKLQVNSPISRNYRHRLSEQGHCLVHVAEEEMALAQIHVCSTVAWVQSESFFDVRDAWLWSASEHERDGQLANCPCV